MAPIVFWESELLAEVGESGDNEAGDEVTVAAEVFGGAV